ncbi:unnamed protein product [Ectocarpus sp. CCAP 1310/34]|nr:unnamed protein product [Ectocarpus sp. CCAP 1310/34]
MLWHYFAVLVRFIGGKYRGGLLNHEFDGNSVHTRWRQSPDGSDAPWTVSRVLEGAGSATAGMDVTTAKTNTSGGRRTTTTAGRAACTPQNVRQKQSRNDQRVTIAACSRL